MQIFKTIHIEMLMSRINLILMASLMTVAVQYFTLAANKDASTVTLTRSRHSISKRHREEMAEA
jgi:hypothetical protein